MAGASVFTVSFYRPSSIVYSPQKKRGPHTLNVIETERLNLREATEEDAAFILELLSDPDFIRHVADRGLRTLEDARRYIVEKFVASYRRNDFGFWLVETKETGEAAGVC